MKAKTIKKVLRAKVDEWAGSIEDQVLKELVKKNTIVTGGSITSMLLGEKVNDFDVYFRSKEVVKRVAEYYVERFKPQTQHGIHCSIKVREEGDRISVVVKSAGIASEEGGDKPYDYFEGRPAEEAGEYVGQIIDDPGEIQDVNDEAEQQSLDTTEDDRPKYRPVFMSSNAITLSQRLQIIIRFWGEAEAIHKNFDFVHCTCYWQSWDDELVLPGPALESMLTRELRYVGSLYPVCSVIRLRKFLKKGWGINAGQILKMVWQINELKLDDYRVLQDQLTGVDAAYFMQLVSLLREKHPEKVNAAYLVEIIDRLF